MLEEHGTIADSHSDQKAYILTDTSPYVSIMAIVIIMKDYLNMQACYTCACVLFYKWTTIEFEYNI